MGGTCFILRMEWEAIVGANIRRLRKAKGLTQEQLAHEAEIAMRYIAGVERGEENPSLRYLVKIAEALEAEPADLLRRDLETATRRRC
ncbi:helix-turn-helix transcriptional regulator [Phenylobacterium sp. NIBR 498073]|uniref:helix-turn-helix domain-containing protein n=1 Tax=Phenylobacterium sp. NIBR 498073 TaxID=3015177 RepID=UPI0022B526AB|nr:helix-turn-helix transcriptional regulator [Phenylobacterium sp. NIBR 498073]WGU40337.1 helix-turn-helix transcriptional regulator [Phenylobacterium sp. NIBR 498073]